MKWRLQVLSAIVLAGAASTTASADMRPVTGKVTNACSLSATQVTFTVRRNGSTYTSSFVPATVTASCNSSGGGVLTLSASRLTGPNNQRDYTLSLGGWGATTMTYTTGSPPPPASTRSNATMGNVTLTLSCVTPDCISSPGLSNGETYTSTITLGLSASS